MSHYQSWRDDANCRDKEPNLFFSEAPLDIERAKSICFGCSVIDDCLEWATYNPTEGILGGHTERERRRLKRKV